MQNIGSKIALSVGLLGLALFVGCSSGRSGAPARTADVTSIPGAVAQASPVAPETNPPGDIPDSQAFVAYRSTAGGYSIQVPEGWARGESGPNVSFVDKLDSITVDVTASDAAPTVQTATTTDVPHLQQQVEAFELVEVDAFDLPAGPAIRIRYRSNSAPDPVTAKQTRLETDRYEFFKDGKMVALSLSAPAGSDNVDVWNLISQSMTWG